MHCADFNFLVWLARRFIRLETSSLNYSLCQSSMHLTEASPELGVNYHRSLKTTLNTRDGGVS